MFKFLRKLFKKPRYLIIQKYDDAGKPYYMVQFGNATKNLWDLKVKRVINSARLYLTTTKFYNVPQAKNAIVEFEYIEANRIHRNVVEIIY